MSKEIPILYSAPMIRAKLAGIKTQTRRVMKLQPEIDSYFEMRLEFKHGLFGCVIDYNQGDENPFIKCPYGQPGDILYARETHYYEKYFNGLTENVFVRYKADMGDEPVSWNWRPNIFLYKEHSRIWDRVVSIRVDRLQDITESDAIAEGINPLLASGTQLAQHGRLYEHYTEHRIGIFGTGLRPVESYATLWESINGNGSWELNPWVWVIETETLSITGKP